MVNMVCKKCGTENRETAIFCEKCGSRLMKACPCCGREVLAIKTFCPFCGANMKNYIAIGTEEINGNPVPNIASEKEFNKKDEPKDSKEQPRIEKKSELIIEDKSKTAVNSPQKEEVTSKIATKVEITSNNVCVSNKAQVVPSSQEKQENNEERKEIALKKQSLQSSSELGKTCFLSKNPFYVSGMSTLATKNDILDKAEELVFDLDDDSIQKVTQELLNSKRRAYWELRWFPCFTIESIKTVVEAIQKKRLTTTVLKMKSLFLNDSDLWEIRKEVPEFNEIRDTAFRIAEINYELLCNEDALPRGENALIESVSTIAKNLEFLTIDKLYNFFLYSRDVQGLARLSKEDISVILKEYIDETRSNVSKCLNGKKNYNFAVNLLNSNISYLNGDLSLIFSDFIKVIKEKANDSVKKIIDEYEQKEYVNKPLTNQYARQIIFKKVDKIIGYLGEYLDIEKILARFGSGSSKDVIQVCLYVRNFAIEIANEGKMYDISSSLINALLDKCPKSREYQDVLEKLRNDKLVLKNNIDASRLKISSGCYIATCVYGSYDCKQVWTLRRFRDCFLQSFFWGRFFIKVYYAISPHIVKSFGGNKVFQRFTKNALDKFVVSLQKKGYKDTPYRDL